MKELCERIDELEYQARGASFTDLVARDIVCEMASCLKRLAREVERIDVASQQAGKRAAR